MGNVDLHLIKGRPAVHSDDDLVIFRLILECILFVPTYLGVSGSILNLSKLLASEQGKKMLFTSISYQT